jgi:hypothetical protein
MIALTREERQLRLVLWLSALVYFIGGLAFGIVPATVLQLINFLSSLLTPSLSPIPISEGKFWVSLAFCMMMTITVSPALAAYNVRNNKLLIIPLLVAKSTASLAAICYFFFSERYFAYLFVFFLDGSLFWMTLYFYVRANRAFLEEQTAWSRKATEPPRDTGLTTVAAFKGEDKFALLDQVLAATKFFDILDKAYQEAFQKSGKSKEDFKVVIKPNFMFMHSRKDISTYTKLQSIDNI